MAFKYLVVVIVLVAALCGCGGDDNDGGGTAVTPPVEVDLKTRSDNVSIETLWVAPYHYWDPNDLPVPSMSLIASTGTAPDFSLARMRLIGSVNGFNFEPGYMYRIRVSKNQILHLSNLPVYTYTWLATEYKQLASGQVFEFEFQKNTQYRRSGTSIKPLNLPLEFYCDMAVCDAIDAHMLRSDVASLVLAAKVQHPGLPLHFTGVKSVVWHAP